MNFPGYVKDGCLYFSPEIARIRTTFLNETKDDTKIVESITRQYPGKTDKQLGAWFGLLISMVLREFDERGWDMQVIFKNVPAGLRMTPDAMYQFLCGMFGEGKTLSQMDTIEASRLFEESRKWIASQWQIYVPDPDPNWREKQE